MRPLTWIAVLMPPVAPPEATRRRYETTRPFNDICFCDDAFDDECTAHLLPQLRSLGQSKLCEYYDHGRLLLFTPKSKIQNLRSLIKSLTCIPYLSLLAGRENGVEIGEVSCFYDHFLG